jgi:hypothetical protein
MDEKEIWRAFDSHPEGLNEGEVAQKILARRQPDPGAEAVAVVGASVDLLPQPVQPAADRARHRLLPRKICLPPGLSP